MLALALALSASVCWGVADFVGGVQARRLPLLTVILVSEAIALAGLAVVVIGWGPRPPDLADLLPSVVGGLAGVAGLMAFYRALAIGTMSIVAPIAATGVCLPVAVGIAGGERPKPVQLAGIVAAVIGVVLVSREPDAHPERRTVARGLLGERVRRSQEVGIATAVAGIALIAAG